MRVCQRRRAQIPQFRHPVFLFCGVALAACGDPSGPPDDLEPESFVLAIRGDIDRDIHGVAHLYEGTLSIDDQPAQPADWISLVVAPPLGNVRLDLTANFILTPVAIGAYAVTALGEGNTLPAPGVWVAFSLDLLDGTTAQFDSRAGTLTVIGMERGEIWGELDVSLAGLVTTDGVAAEAAVTISGRFRAHTD